MNKKIFGISGWVAIGIAGVILFFPVFPYYKGSEPGMYILSFTLRDWGFTPNFQLPVWTSLFLLFAYATVAIFVSREK